jgi:hypothetical protein
VGIHDAYSGIDPQSFEVIADFAVNGIPPGVNLAPKMKPKGPGIWELPLTTPLLDLPQGKLTVAVRDRQGNRTVIDRTFTVGR